MGIVIIAAVMALGLGIAFVLITYRRDCKINRVKVERRCSATVGIDGRHHDRSMVA